MEGKVNHTGGKYRDRLEHHFESWLPHEVPPHMWQVNSTAWPKEKDARDRMRHLRWPAQQSERFPKCWYVLIFNCKDGKSIALSRHALVAMSSQSVQTGCSASRLEQEEKGLMAK